MNYEELVKALRIHASVDIECYECAYYDDCCINGNGHTKMMTDAAAAIEALDSLLDQNTQRCEALRKQLREAHESYEKHLNELEAQLPKLGEWIEDTTTYAGPCLSNYKCSLCGKICGTWRRGLEPSELPNLCGNCGADMRKMEVQDDD